MARALGELTGELFLFLASIWKGVDAKGALADHHVGSHRRHLRHDQVPIFLSRVVASVEHLQTGDLDEEHGGAEDVTGVIRCETQTAGDDDVLVVVDGDG